MRELWDRTGCIEEQLEELGENGVRFEAPQPIPEQGPVGVTVYWPLDGEHHELRVVFGDLFPFFPPTVFAPGWDLPYHQNPLDKNLCLLGRESEFHPRSDTLYAFLTERLGAVRDTARSTDVEELRDREDQQAEPITAYYDYAPGMLVIDGTWVIPDDEEAGVLVVGANQPNLPTGTMVVKTVKGRGGRVLYELDEELSADFGVQWTGRWVRLAEHLREPDSEKYWEHLLEMAPSARPPTNRGTDMAGRPATQEVVMVLAPEEGGWRGKPGQGWVGLTRIKHKGKPATSAFLRVGRSGRGDLAERVPELVDLPHRSVVVVGLGCIGAPLALGLAQAGVGSLGLVDGDFVDPATAVRWPLGLSVAGRLKEDVLSGFIRRQYPFSNAEPVQRGMRLGSATAPEQLKDFYNRVSAADLLVDATADLTVQHFSSQVARGLGVPYLAIGGMRGGWGGWLIRIRPGETGGCWACARTFLVDEGKEPPAAGLEEGMIQPQGCADRTFLGAGVDMSFIALSSTRAAFEVLADGYPNVDWDVQTIALRDPRGAGCLPQVKGYSLARGEGCPACDWFERRSG